MSFHKDFHQYGTKSTTPQQLRRMIVDLDGDIQDAFRRIVDIENTINKILDKKSEFWTDED